MLFIHTIILSSYHHVNSGLCCIIICGNVHPSGIKKADKPNTHKGSVGAIWLKLASNIPESSKKRKKCDCAKIFQHQDSADQTLCLCQTSDP